MQEAKKWARLFINFSVFLFFIALAFYHQTVIYLIYQATGQLTVLYNTQSIESYLNENKLNASETKNLELISHIKHYSVDSLGYKATNNYKTLVNQQKNAQLWVITASEPYQLKSYEWTFPIVGRVNYKGFFKKELAEAEFNHLRCLGYDVDLRTVSAWSTLGWLNDPILSDMLKRTKGGLCNLIFHELFHATYYASNAVDLNENLANFIAHKATQQFLNKDSIELKKYNSTYYDRLLCNQFFVEQTSYLTDYYKTIHNQPNRYELKLKALQTIIDKLSKLELKNKARLVSIKKEILKTGNAYFIDFRQYNGMQDSLEKVFNKIYKGNIKKMVQDLKVNEINY
jgi:predicted aminopeptidase